MVALNQISCPAALQKVCHWLRQRAPAGAQLCADSRRIAAGDVFVAYATNNTDNRPYIADAIARGAAAVIWQSEGFSWPAGLDATPQYTVPQLDLLIGPLASLWYDEPSAAMLMIGTTGTNGKTSCSQWLAQLLSAAGQPCAVIGTLGAGFPDHPHWSQLASTGFTTPDAAQLQQTLASLRACGAQAVSLEVTSHALAQGRVNGVAFDIAVFTHLTQDHLDYHGTMATYEAAKTRLFDWLGLRCAVINRDQPMGQRLLQRLAGKTPVIEYGVACTSPSPHGNAVLYATDVCATSRGIAFTLHHNGKKVSVCIPLLGVFNVSNLLAVFGAMLAADVPFETAYAVLARLTSVRGRMEQLGGAGEPLVVVDYSHTPDALEKALTALRPVAKARGGRLICVFGCGGDRDTSKRPLMGEIAERLADIVVLTSDNPRNEPPGAIIDDIARGLKAPAYTRRIEDRASAILQTIRYAAQADTILLAGKGHEMTQEIRGKQHPFVDQEHARLALAARPYSQIRRGVRA